VKTIAEFVEDGARETSSSVALGVDYSQGTHGRPLAPSGQSSPSWQFGDSGSEGALLDV